ncbi:coiled-coil domain-containing protein 110 isoform X2 [Hyperolius riggenbachi]|uniref:coiled-coil domain-containing protein 110 isoform X2 n=1 Tax=Hyperolius riggenbachi TaxID=752182 RepID=UPI0035A32516
MQEQVMGTSTAAIHSTDLSLSSTENVFQNVQELNKSSQITLEVHSEVTDILNQSIREMEDFHSPFTTEMTSTPKEENKNSSITRREYASLSMTDNISDKVKGEKKQYATTEEKDYPDNPSFHEAGNFPWMVTSEKLSTTKSREHHSDAGQTSPRNVAVQQYSNPQYAEPDDSNSEDTFYCLERDGDGENSRKQNLLAQQANDATKDLSTLGLSDLTSNVNESSLLHDATEMIHDSKHIEPWKRDLLYSDGKERGRMPEEIVDNKHAIHQENLEIHKLKSFLDREDQMNIPDQRTDYESKALRKSLKQLHENARYLRIENLQCRQQITRLTADKNILQLQLSKAEQDAEVYLQQVKVLTEKCEALLNQRQHVQDEGKYLSIDKHSLMKDVEDMRMENKKQLIELLMATAEKEELLKKLDSSKKMLMSCSREKEELHGQLTEALVENCCSGEKYMTVQAYISRRSKA